jgi:hypothetical protein
MFSAKIKEKSIGKMKSMRLLAVLLVPVVALVLGAAVPEAWAKKEFDVAELFFELNNTDGDLGIHALIDGEPWKELEIEAPNGREMLEIEVKGRLRRQGLTEIFFESAEPSFGDLDPADFFLRFPAGTYTIEGETLRGRELENEVELTHVMPAPADGITLNGGEPIVLEAVDCEVGRNVPSVANGSVTISWDPVTMSHPDEEGGGAGVKPPVDVTIVNYEVVVEAELEIGGEEFTSKYSVILPPDVTSATIPAEFISQTDEFKYEILAREESYNQTAIESCFELE